MASTASKLFIFAVILAFSFALTSGTGIACTATSSGVGLAQSNTNLPNNGEGARSITDSIVSLTSNTALQNLGAIGVAVIGLVTGNNLMIFAGLAATAISVIAFSTGVFNAYLGCLGSDFTNLFYTIFGFLSAMSIIAWFGNKFGNEP